MPALTLVLRRALAARAGPNWEALVRRCSSRRSWATLPSRPCSPTMRYCKKNRCFGKRALQPDTCTPARLACSTCALLKRLHRNTSLLPEVSQECALMHYHL